MFETSGFEVMNVDELYYINGGSGSSSPAWGCNINGSFANFSNWEACISITTPRNVYTATAKCENGNYTIEFTKTAR